MNEIRLTRNFLKKPLNSVFILLSITVLIEAVGWSVAYRTKVKVVSNNGGALQYIGILLRSLFIPELFTSFITITLINRFHSFRRLYLIENNWNSIGRYELHFLPVLAGAFLVFNPVTQTVRYLLDSFPSYSWADYWQGYILHTYTWSVYFKYLFPVLLLGYTLLNMSLFSDYLTQRREAQERIEAEAAQTIQKALALSATSSLRPSVPSQYLSYLKGKNALGELDFPVNDVYYFTIVDRCYYAELGKGRYLVGKTLNELEAELDPTQFFRIKRDYIVNRQAVLDYAYWEKGKYVVRLNTPNQYRIIVPRARMQEFREWLQGRYIAMPEHAHSSFS